ncbi:hypothetical protein ACFQV2_34915 [Actinokineospora soli]|uniref:Uncharacterized protein n=1 Tax=Actinokineospora soli TaxID=1048753 RepID=A0ABW2TYN8_9PSEU
MNSSSPSTTRRWNARGAPAVAGSTGSPPSSALRGRIVVAAVAVGAFSAAAAGQTLQSAAGDERPVSADEIMPLANPTDAAASMGMGGDNTGGAPTS